MYMLNDKGYMRKHLILTRIVKNDKGPLQKLDWIVFGRKRLHFTSVHI